MSQPDLTLLRECEAALAWWQAAGVDCDFAEDATALLAQAPLDAPLAQAAGAAQRGLPAADRATAAPRGGRPAHTPPPPPAPTTTRRDLLGDSPPGDLAAFRQWWLEAAELGAARAYPRVPPRGDAGAALMVLVPQPEEEDSARLLSGPQGRLLAAILTAMGMAEEQVYIAAALPCHTPMADLAALAAGGMDAVTAHHIALVRPQRLVAFGTGLAAMLGGSGLSGSGDQPLREINYTGGKVPLLSSEALDAMMDMPRLKARFWRRWMEWSATL
jgi:DNA polymerase